MLISKIVAGVILSLSAINPTFVVEIENGYLDDVGTTYRTVIPPSEATVSCRIVIDEENLKSAPLWFSRRGVSISLKTLREFVLIHELAHCYDSDPPPEGIGLIQWREYLADEFASRELFAQGVIDIRGYDRLIRMRKSSNKAFLSIPMERSIQLLDADEASMTTIDRFNAARRFRSENLTLESISHR